MTRLPSPEWQVSPYTAKETTLKSQRYARFVEIVGKLSASLTRCRLTSPGDDGRSACGLADRVFRQQPGERAYRAVLQRFDGAVVLSHCERRLVHR